VDLTSRIAKRDPVFVSEVEIASAIPRRPFTGANRAKVARLGSCRQCKIRSLKHCDSENCELEYFHGTSSGDFIAAPTHPWLAQRYL